MAFRVNRRGALLTGAVTLVLAVWGRGIGTAFAANDADELIRRFTGGRQPAEGKVKLDLPDIAENGSLVPMTVSVDSPMTVASYVKDVLVVADGNPRGGVVTFHFTPDSGVAEATTRIRLAETQNVIAVAKMSDGSLHVERKQVKVTIGGCGG
jgi:sulfur-oxidizing protein SoxY